MLCELRPSCKDISFLTIEYSLTCYVFLRRVLVLLDITALTFGALDQLNSTPLEDVAVQQSRKLCRRPILFLVSEAECPLRNFAPEIFKAALPLLRCRMQFRSRPGKNPNRNAGATKKLEDQAARERSSAARLREFANRQC